MNCWAFGVHRRHAPLGKIVLLFALLLMHIVGGDHATATTTASHSGPHAAVDQPTGAGVLPVQHAAPAPVDIGDAGCAGDGCGMQMSMVGACIVAFLGGGILLHRVSRLGVPVPGRGLAAPPMWRALPAIPVSPSLVQLSISRT